MKSVILSLLIACLALAADLGSKFWVVTGLDLQSRLAIDVLPPLLNFRMGWNEGINFGLFSGAPEVVRYALIGIAVAVALGAIIWSRTRSDMLSLISAGLLVGGALGNAWDRLVFGAVRDFLNMSCCGIRNPYVFNVADIAVFAGIFGLVYILEIRKS